MNPGNALSSQYAPLSKVHFSFILVWIVSAFLWYSNLIWRCKQFTKLRGAISLIPFAMLLWELGAFSFYYGSSYLWSEPPDAKLLGLLRTLSVCVFCGVLLLMSRGWGICVALHSSKRDIPNTAAVLLFFGIGWSIGQWLELVMLLSNSFMAYFVLLFTRDILLRLETMQDDPDGEFDETLSGTFNVEQQKLIMNRFNVLMNLYFALWVIVSLTSPTRHSNWMEGPSDREADLLQLELDNGLVLWDSPHLCIPCDCVSLTGT